MSHDPKKKAVESIPYRASEELFQALFEQTIDGIFIADQHGRYVEANRRSCEMLCYTREEILNLSWPDLIPAKDLARYRAVTPGTVSTAVSRWLTPEKAAVLRVLPEEAEEVTP